MNRLFCGRHQLWFTIFTVVLLGMVTTMTACSKREIHPETNPPTTPSSTLTNQQPIEVVSLIGPLAPVNPGGPNVQMVLKNISSEPIVTLTVILELNRPFNFIFDVSLPVPLLPAKTISAEQNLIGGGFSESILYPLRISGTFQNSATFSYVKQVQIKPY